MDTQSALLQELLGTMDTKIFTLVLQLILVGAVMMWIKDVTGRIVNYYKLKMSDFGRGTNIQIGEYKGQIYSIGFNEVEITLENDDTLLIPADAFIKSKKIIINNRNEN